MFVNFPNNHDCGPVIKLEVPQFEKFVVPLEAKVSCFTPKHQWPLPQCSVAKRAVDFKVSIFVFVLFLLIILKI